MNMFVIKSKPETKSLEEQILEKYDSFESSFIIINFIISNTVNKLSLNKTNMTSSKIQEFYSQFKSLKIKSRSSLDELKGFYYEAITKYLDSIGVDTKYMTPIAKIDRLDRELVIGKKPSFYDKMYRVEEMSHIIQYNLLSD